MIENQEFLTPEEVEKLQPQDVAEYSTEVKDGIVHEYFGDLDAPVLFEISEEGKSILCVRGWSTYDLVSFGNYMLNRYPQKLKESEANNDVLMPVTDADLANWRFLSSQNKPSLQDTVSEDDGNFPGDGTNLGEEWQD